MKKLFFALLCCIFLSSVGYAACSGSSPNWSAADCSKIEITDCITRAKRGDTVNVAAGTCTWTGTVTIPETKTIKLIGAGSSNTIISRNCARMLVSQSPNSRISGFRFNMIGSCSSDTYSVEMKNTGWRLDHNYFDNQSTFDVMTAVSANGTNMDMLPEGIIDSNTFNECRPSSDGAGNFAKANTAWTMDTLFGMDAGVHNVYIENNTITVTTDHITLDIAWNAGSYVFRYNDINGGPVMAHSNQGGRGSKSWEIYNNNFAFVTTDFNYIGFMRGGTGMFYNNLVTGPYSGSYVITLDNVRSIPGECPGCTSNPPGYCNGTSLWDGNTPGQRGWPCRDQIGRGKDTSLSTMSNMQPQISQPAYFWNNKRSTGANVGISIGNGCGNWIQEGRDFYSAASYDALVSKPTGYTRYTCPHPLVGFGSCDPNVAGTAGYNSASRRKF